MERKVFRSFETPPLARAIAEAQRTGRCVTVQSKSGATHTAHVRTCEGRSCRCADVAAIREEHKAYNAEHFPLDNG
jgi:hypothetical protein